jgi:hypothetical protein
MQRYARIHGFMKHIGIAPFNLVNIPEFCVLILLLSIHYLAQGTQRAQRPHTPNVIAWRQRRCAISLACQTVNGSLCGMLLSHAEVRRRGGVLYFPFSIRYRAQRTRRTHWYYVVVDKYLSMQDVCLVRKEGAECAGHTSFSIFNFSLSILMYNFAK